MTRYITDVTLLYVNIGSDLVASTVFRNNVTGEVFEIPGGPVKVIGVSKDEGDRAEEQPQGDQVDPGRVEAEGSDAEADGGENPQQDVQSDGHSLSITLSGRCSHGFPWEGMNYSHWAMEHKADHP